jgi:D-lyxose ketol-isomerase
MKRSEINKIIQNAKNILENNHFCLLAFAYWTMEEWESQYSQIDNLKAIGLGWDVTDFGTDDFEHTGAVLFTIRNGSLDDKNLGTPYAEKIIIQKHETEQEIPLHYHNMKTEDIINRGGGILVLELFNSYPDGGIDRDSEITVKMDGFIRTLPAGAVVEVKKGDSITLHPGLYHRFWAKKGEGDLVIGEVSSINNDNTDNMFFGGKLRFSEIEEDEPALVPLCGEYDIYFQKDKGDNK